MAEAKPIQRDDAGRVVAGSGSLNPGGRPKGAAARVRALSKDGNGEEPLEFLYAVMRGEVPKKKVFEWEPFPEPPSVETRARCALKLWEHQVGKAPQAIKLSEGTAADELEGISDAELDQLLLEQVLAKTATDPKLRDQVLAALATGTEQ